MLSESRLTQEDNVQNIVQIQPCYGLGTPKKSLSPSSIWYTTQSNQKQTKTYRSDPRPYPFRQNYESAAPSFFVDRKNIVFFSSQKLVITWDSLELSHIVRILRIINYLISLLNILSNHKLLLKPSDNTSSIKGWIWVNPLPLFRIKIFQNTGDIWKEKWWLCFISQDNYTF